MFDGVPVEQFHQFVSTPSSRIIPPNSSLIQTQPILTSTNINFLSFDPILFPPTHHQTLFQPNQFVRTPTRVDQFNGTHEGKMDEEMDTNDNTWSNDEVIQLLRIKSSSENWFRDFTWDHVSRKLAEMGYKKSAEKCKEKYEVETCTSFSSSTIGYNKNINRYMINEEVDENLYNNSADQNTHHKVTTELSENMNHHEQPQVHEKVAEEQNLEDQGQKCHFEKDPVEVIVQPTDQDDVQVTKSKKRKRKHKNFKMVKGMCIDLVKKMMAKQEEMHKMLLEDMANRDEEKIKREEAWRKDEMERVQKEFQIREHEQEMARDRQSTINEYLNKITSFDKKIQIPFDMDLQELQTNIANIDKLMSSSEITKTPSLDMITEKSNQYQLTAKDDIGKRWPRDEVLALINIRSKVNNGIGVGNNEEHKGGGSLWERISQGMLDLGYKRSAKRCKEKWENINKYFRKTKDANKKRSLDSRTCPYYYELSKLYNQEKVALSSNSGPPSSNEPENTTIIMPES
ncbi:trihelix transcription factor GTL2 [Rutidosis leptorrhynchoides]|uniref:trihelix transcription factor GTL2 n=1 Tax=Rutidosis leptorrhynchoides TaxID=125765 RepID=UPI003A997B6C